MELIKITSSKLPDDIKNDLLRRIDNEKSGTPARYAMEIIKDNLALAEKKEQPICQDTGSLLFFVKAPKGFDQLKFIEDAKAAVVEATTIGYLRQNSVDSLTGRNTGNNLGAGAPYFHFEQHASNDVDVRFVMKGGGCENCGIQYSLPNAALNAQRDIDGVRKCILDSVLKAQGKGCAPGYLGVCIGGDRATGYACSKEQLLRKLDDVNPNEVLAKLEKDILETSNKLGIGPMGFGGATTLFGCKIGALNRLPASYFVSITYMCWAFRRQGILMDLDGKIAKWLY